MKTESAISLFEPRVLNNLELKNSFVMAPMTRSRAVGFTPNDLMVAYYQQRSTAGLIITEGTAPAPNGLGYSRTPGIYSQEQIEGWKKVTDAVHENDSKIFLQLMHVGRIAHPANQPDGAEILAPSPIAAKGEMWTDQLGMQSYPTPKEMSIIDIDIAIQEFKQAAINAIEAGFDGVELHGANGYLLEQFLNPHSNQRKDGYGGSYVNRSKFALEVTREVVEAIGKEKVGIRFSPYSTFNDLTVYDDTYTTYDYLTKELNKMDIVYLHISEGAASTSEEGRGLIQRIRDNFQNTLILNGGYDKDLAQLALENNKADLIAFGRPFISNPDLPQRFKNDLELNPLDFNTFYTADSKGYIDYPTYK